MALPNIVPPASFDDDVIAYDIVHLLQLCSLSDEGGSGDGPCSAAVVVTRPCAAVALSRAGVL
jgi:hypothetical protein